MKTITSIHNEEVKSVAKLASTKERALQGKYIGEGLRTCQTLLEGDAQLIKLYITDEHEGVALSLTSEDLITIVDPNVMAKMSQTTSPSGFLGVFALPSEPDVKKLTAGMVLARIADPGNMGTLIRSCAAFGAQSVVVVEGCDPFSPKVVHATVGTIANVQIFQWSWQELLANTQNIKLAALVVDGGKAPQLQGLAQEHAWWQPDDEPEHGLRAEQGAHLPELAEQENPDRDPGEIQHAKARIHLAEPYHHHGVTTMPRDDQATPLRTNA